MKNTQKVTTPYPPALLSVKQAAAYMQIGINNTYGLIKRPDDPLPVTRFGRTIRIPVKQLDAWLERQADV